MRCLTAVRVVRIDMPSMTPTVTNENQPRGRQNRRRRSDVCRINRINIRRLNALAAATATQAASEGQQSSNAPDPVVDVEQDASEAWPNQFRSPKMSPKAFKVNNMTRISTMVTALINNKEYWHKFIVHGGSVHDKSVVLKTILSFGYATEFIPVLYRKEGDSDTSFLARGCGSTIDKLFRYSFTLQIEGNNDTSKMLSLEVILCHMHMNTLGLSLHENLTQCIIKRYDRTSRSLDLSNFHNDPDLVDMFYCPLWLPKVLHYVLVRAKSMGKMISSMYLNGNELSQIKPLNVWSEMSSLRVVDLGDNKLETIDVLMALRPLKLTELVLDKNPLCALYTTEDSYIRDVRSFIPTLKKLDGVYLCEPGIPCWRQNYVVSEEGIEFVDQFLERYFTLFDSENRQWLQGMYHDEACFSLSATYLPSQSTSSTARLLTHYTMESRNLLKVSDYTKSYRLLSRGPDIVIATLCRLPKTEHDPFSFAVDLAQYSPNHAVITVSGVFREPSVMNKGSVRFFNRTFVLLKVATLQYQITNEILLVSNATSWQAEESFKITRPTMSMSKVALLSVNQLTDVDRHQMMDSLAQLTEMNLCWARKCLEESKWKIREALQVFTELLKMDKIPAEAFLRE